jgi:AcrR family transcriptional regulator
MNISKSNHKETYSKVENNKTEKLNKLLDTAFQLFADKGFKKTSIQDIVDNAGVAKGTFYLYFKDKYEIQDYLLARTSYKLFNRSLKEAEINNIQRLDDKIIYIINYIIDTLVKSPLLINFIQKNLSLGLYSEKITILMDSEELGLKELFLNEVKQRKLSIPHPEVTLFMIIELVGSTCFSSIVKKEPVPIEEYKPILYKTIKMMINEK